jgi:hypothetical protein
VSLWPSKQRNGTSSGAFDRSLEPKTRNYFELSNSFSKHFGE